MTTYRKDYISTFSRSFLYVILTPQTSFINFFVSWKGKKGILVMINSQITEVCGPLFSDCFIKKGRFLVFSIFRVSFKQDFSSAPKSFIDLHGLLFWLRDWGRWRGLCLDVWYSNFTNKQLQRQNFNWRTLQVLI